MGDTARRWGCFLVIVSFFLAQYAFGASSAPPTVPQASDGISIYQTTFVTSQNNQTVTTSFSINAPLTTTQPYLLRFSAQDCKDLKRVEIKLNNDLISYGNLAKCAQALDLVVTLKQNNTLKIKAKDKGTYTVKAVAMFSAPIFNRDVRTERGHTRKTLIFAGTPGKKAVLRISGDDDEDDDRWCDDENETGLLNLRGTVKFNGATAFNHQVLHRRHFILNTSVTLAASNTIVLDLQGTRRHDKINVQVIPIDIEPPILTILDPQDGFLTNELEVLVSGIVTDSGSTRVVINGETYPVISGGFSVPVPLENEGANDIFVKAIDGNGLESPEQGMTIFRDTQPPEVFVYVSQGGQRVPLEGLTFTQIELPLNAQSNEPLTALVFTFQGEEYSLGESITPAPGQNVVLVHAVDEAGNIADFSVSFIYEADRDGDGVLDQDDAFPDSPTAFAVATPMPDSSYVLGSVRDSESDSPVAGALVIVEGYAVLTDGDGTYRFPANYFTSSKKEALIRVEKNGYLPLERREPLVAGGAQSLPTLRIKARDTQITIVTPVVQPGQEIDDQGRQVARNSDGTVEVHIPNGALSDPVAMTFTSYTKGDQLEALLPASSHFTMAADLSPSMEFQQPVEVRFKNILDFPPGTQIPVGLLTEQRYLPESVVGKFRGIAKYWLHDTMATVSPDGIWVSYETSHFSTPDVNSPAVCSGTCPPPDDPGEPPPDDECSEGSVLALCSGNVLKSFALPSYKVNGKTITRELVYNSETVSPNPFIEVATGTPINNLGRSAWDFALEFNGKRFHVDYDPIDGSYVHRALLDRRDPALRDLQTGAYPYRVSNAYTFSDLFYATTDRFGGEPIDTLPVPVREPLKAEKRSTGYKKIINRTHSSFGAGWHLAELERIHNTVGNLPLLVHGDGRAVLFRPGTMLDLSFDDDAPEYAKDSSGNINDAFFYQTSHEPGIKGQALRFSAADESLAYIDYNKSLEMSSAFTLATWLKIDSNAFPPSAQLFRRFIHVPDFNFVLNIEEDLGEDSLYSVVMHTSDGATDSFLQAFDLPGNQWVHLAITFGPDARRIYVNGQLQEEDVGVGPIPVSPYTFDPLFIGGFQFPENRPPGHFSFNGLMDEFKLYQRDLSADDVQDLYSGQQDKQQFFGEFSESSKLYRYGDGHYERLLAGGEKRIYLPSGLLSQALDKNGNATLYTYDAEEKLVSITDERGGVTTFSYDGSGKLSAITDPAGRTTAIGMSGDDLVSIAVPGGDETRYTYDAEHFLTSHETPTGDEYTYTYNSYGMLIAQGRPDGGAQSLDPIDDEDLLNDLSGTATPSAGENLIADLIDPNGNASTYRNDKINRTRTRTDAVGRSTFSEYDDKGLVTLRRDQTGLSSTYTYDARFLQVASEVTNTGRNIRYIYDDSGDLTRIIDKDELEQDLVTEYLYDEHGNRVAEIFPDGSSRTMTYDSAGLVLSMTDEANHTTHYSYDSLGNRISMTDGMSRTTSYDYDARGNLIREDFPDGTFMTRTYDNTDRLISLTDQAGKTWTYTYTPTCGGCPSESKLASITDPLNQTTTITYDYAGHELRRTFPDASYEESTYDFAGNLIAKRDRRGHTMAYSYDEANRLIEIVDQENYRTFLDYDFIDDAVIEDRVIVTDANGNETTTAQIIADGRAKQRESRTDGFFLEQRYDRQGRLIAAEYSDGTTATFTYDSRNRVVSKVTPDDTVTYSYFPDGLLETLSNDDANLSYAYDNSHQVISESISASAHQPAAVLSYDYDQMGRVLRIGESNSGTNLFPHYNQRGQFQSIDDGARLFVSIERDDKGRRASEHHFNQVHRVYAYTSTDRIASIEDTRFGDPVLSQSYSHGAGDNIIARTVEGLLESFAYDRKNQITAASDVSDSLSYVYDGAGNRTADAFQTYTIGGYNRLSEDSSYLYAYDGRGNIIEKRNKATNAYEVFVYSSENRMWEYRSYSPSDVLLQELLFTYDGKGRRIEKSVSDTATTAITRWIYQNDDAFLEYDGANTLKRVYINNLQVIDEKIAFIEQPSGNAYYFHKDHVNSIFAITDAAGTKVQEYRYEPFGKLRSILNPSFANSFTYTGRELDENGYYYYRARSYDPVMGRFLGEDPITDLNIVIYSYVSNNPLLFVDPTGKMGCLPPGVECNACVTGKNFSGCTSESCCNLRLAGCAASCDLAISKPQCVAKCTECNNECYYAYTKCREKFN